MKLLVPMDGSDNAVRALEYALSLQDHFKEPPEIHLLNVQRPILSGNVKTYISSEQLHAYYEDEGAEALKRGREMLAASSVRHSAQVALGEEPVAITTYATTLQCNLIVMGTRGMGSLANLLMGSVASKVVHLAPVPVVLVK